MIRENNQGTYITINQGSVYFSAGCFKDLFHIDRVYNYQSPESRNNLRITFFTDVGKDAIAVRVASEGTYALGRGLITCVLSNVMPLGRYYFELNDQEGKFIFKLNK